MFYSLKEGFTGLFRAKLSSTIAISIICLSLILIGIFLIFVLNSKRLIDSIEDRIELEVFIDNSYDSVQIEQLKNKILAINSVKKISYTSKEMAAEIFRQQFDKDIFEILDENPLPASFQIRLAKPFQTSQKANQLIEKLKSLDGVDDVIFRQDILLLLEKYIKISFLVILIIGGLLAIGSIYLISSTIKLIILSRIEIIETMKLVGATKSFIRRPFVVEGVIQGFLGSILATLVFYNVMKIINIEIPKLIIISKEVFFIIFSFGILLGFLGSILAIQRFLRY